MPFDNLSYHILSNYHTYPYKRSQAILKSSDYSHYKGLICCEYPFELHQLVDAIQMSTHNKCFYIENQRKKTT